MNTPNNDALSCCSGAAPDEGSGGLGRRSLLRAGGLGSIGLMAGHLAAASPAAAAPIGATAKGSDHRGMKLLLLGTRGGLPPEAGRAGISSAVIIDGRNYLVDCGYASAWQYARAGLRRADLAGIFITHLHADHVADYYNTIMMGAITGLPYLDVIPAHVTAYGPGPAGALPDPFGGTTVPVINPANPTPGLVTLTEDCHAAYAYSSNVFMRDAGMRDIRELVDPREIAIPDVGASARGETAPTMRPFTVMEDDRVKVSAILVPHGPVFPAFAYRFDSDYGSVTFSGDTRLHENVTTLARASNILVHEAISDPAEVGLPDAIKSHMLLSHTLVGDTGRVAEEASVDHLVLSHIGDFTGQVKRGKWLRLARRGFDGCVTIGDDLMSIPVRAARRPRRRVS